MHFIDMTAQLAPIAYGLIAMLVISGLALFVSAAAPAVTTRLQRRARPRLVLTGRPALAGQTR